LICPSSHSLAKATKDFTTSLLDFIVLCSVLM
jgi:hypothetical protein